MTLIPIDTVIFINFIPESENVTALECAIMKNGHQHHDT